MSEDTQALGIPVSLTYRGRTYRFAPMDTLEVVANYESYLEEQGWLALQRAKRHLTPQDYQEQADGVRRDAVSGVYCYGSKYFFQSLQCLAHQRRLLWLMASFHDRGVTEAEIAEFYKDAAFVEDLVRKVLGAGEGDAPNGKAPGTAPATTGP